MVQLVRTSWTKRSRGGEGAARRNAVPVAFPLNDTRPAVHEVLLREERGFVPEWKAVRDALETDDVSLREEDGRLRVFVNDDRYGMPRRHRRPTAVRVLPGEWARWQINQRFAGGCCCGAEWRYQLLTLNVAYGEVRDPAVFLGEPSRVVDERALLR